MKRPLNCNPFSFALLLAALFASCSLRAQTDPKEAADARSVDKGQYNLFHRTPADRMREFNTDRPDVTESPITVDAGHFQLELSFVEYGRDRNRGADDEFDVLPFNLKVGLLNNVDLEFVFTPYATDSERSAGSPVGSASTNRSSGSGNLALRLKINFWGNDGPNPVFGGTAFGVMPFISLPVNTDRFESGHVEGGLIFPVTVDLPGKFDLGLMAEVDFVRDPNDTRYGVEFIHTATLDHQIVGPFRGYVEYVGIAPRRTGSSYRASFSTGLTYALGENAQLDAGVLVGLNRQAEDLRLFSGLSVRF